MLLAAIDDFGYRLFLLLHILSVIVAFAPGFVWPVVTAGSAGTAVSRSGPSCRRSSSATRSGSTARRCWPPGSSVSP